MRPEITKNDAEGPRSTPGGSGEYNTLTRRWVTPGMGICIRFCFRSLLISIACRAILFRVWRFALRSSFGLQLLVALSFVPVLTWG